MHLSFVTCISNQLSWIIFSTNTYTVYMQCIPIYPTYTVIYRVKWNIFLFIQCFKLKVRMWFVVVLAVTTYDNKNAFIQFVHVHIYAWCMNRNCGFFLLIVVQTLYSIVLSTELKTQFVCGYRFLSNVNGDMKIE